MLLTRTYNTDLLSDVFDTFLNLPREFSTDYKIDGDNIKMEFDVPGFSKTDFTISADDFILTIEGKTDGRTFNKRLKINKDFDLSKTEAIVENGVLNLTIPKLEDKKRKLIQIKVK
tara:strand:+ start:341 stop:688 length:348 start_codon:yes stop_codon:yes gene_type:complete